LQAISSDENAAADGEKADAAEWAEFAGGHGEGVV